MCHERRPISGRDSSILRSQNDICDSRVLARKLLSVDATVKRRRHPEMQEQFLTEAREFTRFDA
jgi:hypothetical protein